MKRLSILTFALLTVALTSATPEATKTTASGDKNASSDDVDLMGIMDQCNETFVIQMYITESYRELVESDLSSLRQLIPYLDTDGLLRVGGRIDRADIAEDTKHLIKLSYFTQKTAYMQALNDSGSFPDETERNPKCYVKCVLEKAGVMSAEGVFNPTRAAMVFAGDSGGRPMDDVVDMTAECGNKRAESCKCERAYQYVKCLMEMEIQRYEKSGQKAQRRIVIL